MQTLRGNGRMENGYFILNMSVTLYLAAHLFGTDSRNTIVNILLAVTQLAIVRSNQD